MKETQHRIWFCRQLPALVAEGVLSEEAAVALRRRFSVPDPAAAGRSLARLLCAVLGATLIGLGIILLLAHNWNEIPRLGRTALALGPLLAAQLLSGWVLARRGASPAWREGAGAFQFITMGSSIALISQIYHLPGDLAIFLLTWLLLGLPLVYLLRANLPALFYLAGLTAWCFAQWRMDAATLLYWGLLAALAPHFILALHAGRRAPRVVLLSWVLALSLCCAVGVTLATARQGSWMMLYASLFAVMTLSESAGGEPAGAVALVRRPFLVIGTAGTLLLGFLLTYQHAWVKIPDLSRPSEWTGGRLAGWVADGLSLALCGAAVIFLVARWRRSRQAGAWGLLPLCILLGYGLAGAWMPAGAIVIFFNLVVLALAALTSLDGFRRNQLRVVNFGLAIFAVWVALRFFDSDLGFVARSLAFIALGVGFLAVNTILLRRWRIVQ